MVYPMADALYFINTHEGEGAHKAVVCSGSVPITVSTITDLPPAGHRMSPRTLLSLLMVLTMVVSEVVARCSLPPAPPPSTGHVANLIPFKNLNLCILIHLSVSLAFSLFVITYQIIISSVGHHKIDTGEKAAKTAGFFLAIDLVCVLLLNRKAREFTRRKLAGWWAVQELPTCWTLKSASTTIHPSNMKTTQTGQEQPEQPEQREQVPDSSRQILVQPARTSLV